MQQALATEPVTQADRRGQQAVVADLPNGQTRAARAAAFGKQLEQTQPNVFAEPEARFALAAAHREQGFGRQAERFYLGLRRTRPRDAWWSCAEGEQWLAEPKGEPPKRLWNCARAASKPRLDGKLDEPMWKQAAPIELHSPHRDDADWPAVALAACDGEYLYLAVSCKQAAGAKYADDDSPRSRDADLSQHDRVDIAIDLDRDFATAYRLSVDHRGWTHDSCWGDASWNPQWFVAAATADDTWTAEAAIPLAELTGQAPAAKSAWAVGVLRIVPGVGYQTWTRPAMIDDQLEGLGYLIFE